MKSRVKVLLVICFVILASSYLLASCYSRHMRKTSPMFNFVFPPEDIYEPLAQLPFSSSLADKLYECSFSTKYPGLHSVEVLVSNPVKVMESYGEQFSVEITIKDEDGTVLMKETASPPHSPFWGVNESGLKLLSFKTPDNVPLGNLLTAYVRVKMKDDSFENEFGPLELRIVKMSDE